MVAVAWTFALLGAAEAAAAASSSSGASDGHQTCGDLKAVYKANECCGNPDKALHMQVVPRPMGKMLDLAANPCDGTKPEDGAGFDNVACVVDAINEQAGADVSDGANGNKDTDATPITSTYMVAGLCPVNVHWHLGAEHLSTGHYDASGTKPAGRRLEEELPESYHRKLAGDVRYGGTCHHYDSSDASGIWEEYDWKHCEGMHVGDTYEVHWPHSRVGACGTPHQYQSPFYDGVFCHFNDAVAALGAEPVYGGPASGSGAPAGANLSGHVGVQAQVFTIVNDEDYFYPDLMRGMIIDGEYGKHMAYYTGSTTGTSRNNADSCSQYTPITWQVDRRCHLISASTFDKMCADMKMQADDMSMDLHAHGSREVVSPEFAANNQHQATRDVPGFASR